MINKLIKKIFLIALIINLLIPSRLLYSYSLAPEGKFTFLLATTFYGCYLLKESYPKNNKDSQSSQKDIQPYPVEVNYYKYYSGLLLIIPSIFGLNMIIPTLDKKSLPKRLLRGFASYLLENYDL